MQPKVRKRRPSPKRLVSARAVKHREEREHANGASPVQVSAPRILIVDDHAVVRLGLNAVLKQEFPDAKIAEASNAQEALEKSWAGKWDLVFLDICMPGRNGLELLKELKRQFPKLPVLVISANSEEDLAVRALRGGAAGFLAKDSPPAEWTTGARKALSGGKYITPWLAEKMATRIESSANGDRAPHESLSDREYQVMSMLSAGQTVKEIAAEISLSIKTISTYRTRILEKMRLRNNAELMRYSVQNGLANLTAPISHAG